MYLRCVLLLSIMLSAGKAWADWSNCVTLDLSAWTPAQRGFLHHVIAESLNNAPTRYSFIEGNLKICAELADLSGLNTAILQTAAQANVDAYTAGSTARQVIIDEARTEVTNNTLCNATLAQVITRIDAEKAAIQTDIDASANLTLAKVALTTINNRYGAALKAIARCIKGRVILQENRQ